MGDLSNVLHPLRSSHIELTRLRTGQRRKNPNTKFGKSKPRKQQPIRLNILRYSKAVPFHYPTEEELAKAGRSLRSPRAELGAGSLVGYATQGCKSWVVAIVGRSRCGGSTEARIHMYACAYSYL